MTSKSLSNLSAKHHTDNKMTNDDDVLANFKKFCKRRPFWCEPVNEKIMEYVAVVPERIIRQEKAKILEEISRVFDLRINGNRTDFRNFGIYGDESEKLEHLLRKEKWYHLSLKMPPPPPPFKFEVGMTFNERFARRSVEVVGRTRHFVKLRELPNSLEDESDLQERRKKIRQESETYYQFGEEVRIMNEYSYWGASGSFWHCFKLEKKNVI